MSAVLGIDVGGTKVALRLEPDGQPPREAGFAWPGSSTADDDLARLHGHARTLIGDHVVRAVGVAMPATLDGAGRVTAWPTRPAWTGLDLRAALDRRFGPALVRVADDGDLAAIAEAAAAGCADVVYLGVGTGIGGGAVVGGRPCPGPGRGSCEVGHILVDRAGPRCDCGRAGCLQAIASGASTLRRAAAARGAPVTFDELREAWPAGAAWAVSTVQESAAALAAAAVSLGELFRPSLTLIGGGFAAGLPGFVPAVAERSAALGRPGHPPAPVRAATLGAVSSLHGALLLARAAD
ncbi:ROK family protein [Dactylosporangium sp. NPDC049140]|uniref:ROK family protein n=1 Tax=Dactylosporangium sp. NPDC049140 TaxID=3155647 RepID=UPI0034004BAA